MSFKKAFTKMGLIEEEVVAPTKTRPQPTPTFSNSAPASFENSHYPTSYVATPKVDDAIAKTLQQSLQESKLSGFDYLKFVASTEEMKIYGTPEDARYKMAFSAAKQLGVDKDSLVKSGQHYLDVLHQDDTDFQTECTQYEKREIQAKEAKVTELEAKLASLSEQLAQAKQERDGLVSEVAEKKASLDSRRASFQTTLQSFVTDIENNLSKINKYLS